MLVETTLDYYSAGINHELVALIKDGFCKVSILKFLLGIWSWLRG